MEIDKIDRKILYELDKSSRSSFSEMAKKLGTSPQVVKYRFENLVKRGILKYCWPMVEYRAVGYFFNLCFIKLQNLNKGSESELYDYLNSHSYIPIIMRGEGYADLIIAICSKGIFHSAQIMSELNSRFSRYFLEYDIAIPIGFSRFYRNYLVDKKELTPNVAFTGADIKEADLNILDRKILSLINFNARASLVDIARKLSITIDIARNRLKKLENLGIIQCYTILMDHVKAGYPRHRVLLKLKNLTEEGERELFTYCNLHPNIIHHLKVLGYWDLVIDVEIGSREEFRKLMMEMKFKFSKIIHRIEPTYIYKIDQFRDIPIEYTEYNIIRS